MSNNDAHNEQPIIFDDTDDGNDDDDLFADDFVSKRRGANAPGTLPKPLAELTEEEADELNAKHRAMIPRKRSTRRRLEGKASNKLRDYLFKHYGAITTRANSGEWIDNAGNTIRGAETGTSDILACVPIDIGGMRFGVYFAFEVKSVVNKSQGTEPQQKFIARVKTAGGYGAVVRTSLDVDAVIAEKRQAMIDDLRAFVDRIVKPKNQP